MGPEALMQRRTSLQERRGEERRGEWVQRAQPNGEEGPGR